MAAGNFDNEIKDSMLPTSKAVPTKGVRPPPMPASQHNGGAVAQPPPPPHQFHPPQQTGQNGMQQAAGVPAPGMGGPTPQQGGHLAAAHAQIINALAQRDRGM